MKKKSLENHSRLAVAFHLPAFFVLSVITLGPLLYTLKISFFDYKLSSSGSEDVFVGLQNYINMFQDAEFMNSMAKTFIFMACSVTLEVINGGCDSYGCLGMGAVSGSRVPCGPSVNLRRIL